FDKITFTPQFCKGILKPNIETTLFGQQYAAPFGISPVGLTGLMWPKIEMHLAASANHYQIPYTLSTVATETPETVGQHVGNMGWFQLYPPREEELMKAILKRAADAGFHTLMVTADVPMASRRERTKRAGLQMPPKITPNFKAWFTTFTNHRKICSSKKYEVCQRLCWQSFGRHFIVGILRKNP
ncbi:MAG: alpha-hydroxy acid oxidase, partial [Saprospiraceae bacterium]